MSATVPNTAASATTSPANAAPQADVEHAKRLIADFVDRSLPEYQRISLAIHDKPEVSNYEFFASTTLSDQLKAEGFDVTLGVASHRTGFEAVYDTGRPGPTVVFLAEYDALPGIGHGCGHSVFGPNSSLAGAALKQVIDQFGGQVRVYGTPGEEGGENGSAKGAFVDEGFFKDVDIALAAHPGSGGNHLTTRNLACQPVDIEFHGKASHASGSPELGVNALDGVIQTFNSINALRQHLPKDVRIHGIITDGGVQPNVVPDYAKAKFYLRSASVPGLLELRRKIENIVAGSALATGAKGSLEPYQHQVDNMIPTPLFDAVWERNAVALGQRVEPTEQDKVSFGSSDVGNVSQVVPTIQPVFAIAPEPLGGHNEKVAAAAASEFALESIRWSAKALAFTALDVLTNPALLAAIKEQHAGRVATQQSDVAAAI
ncbi:amidohydrolase [Bifidobacterium ramosum]|uniref:Peptidase M20 domain-containing protein 2 n=1 Tax=Bifidobacterium ramosum TaxID=1798158 RepID=A0A6L4X163_9BIFI|nr:M20 family metallopeptidase [Bifidobacterium ramosum]KAB8288286.1 amidohydrolase [Bifidobacterium ramosum]NEG71676.1 amidohydrolase [Bifidobacterium ramosum]